MNNAFNSNPIIVTNGGKVVNFIELDYSYEDIDFILEVKDSQNNHIFNDFFTGNDLISIDVSVGSIELTYTEIESNEILAKKKINLSDFEISDEFLAKQLSSKKERERFFYISEVVKKRLDSPEGTPKEVEIHTEMLNRATMDNNARKYTEDKIRQIIQKELYLDDDTLKSYTEEIYSKFYGMGVLQKLDDDPEIGEILVNGFVHPEFRCDIYYIKNGIKYKYDKTFENLDELKNVYGRAIAFSRKELNNVENAMVEATRANRDRVNIVIPDACESWALNIRKFGNFVPSANSMKKYGTVNDDIEELLQLIVKGKANIGIGGEMGTGKTTFINYLLTFTQPDERKCVIASVSETDVERVLKGHDVLIFNVDELKGFSFAKLIRASLRTTSDRVIIPESRGDEFKQVYEANLKTKGNMFTAHALTDYEFLDMCVDMYNGENSNADINNVKNKISKAVDIIVIMRKVGATIRIKSISEIVLNPETKNFERMNPLWVWESDKEDSTKGFYKRTGNKITDALRSRLNEYGVPYSKMENI